MSTRQKFDVELVVGLFVIFGIIALGYVSVKFGELEVLGNNRYVVFAEFEKAGGIKAGSIVEIAGVEVGKVKSIRLNEDYQAAVELLIDNEVKIQDDAIASIKTKGLIGERYISITPGGSEKLIAEGGIIRETESAVDMEELVSKYVFGDI